MNLLVVTDVFPFPPHHGSSVISYNWLRCLVKSQRVSLLSLDPARDLEATQALTRLNVRVLPNVRTPFPRVRRVLRGLSPCPGTASEIAAARIRRYLLKQTTDCDIDAVVLIGPSLVALLQDGRWPVPVAFVPYDSVASNLQGRLPFVAGRFRRVYYYLEFKKWQYAEACLYSIADICIAVTERDAKCITAKWNQADRNRMHVLPNGVDSAYFSPKGTLTQRHHLVATGNLQAIQSVMSFKWFLSEVFPKIKARVPDATINIVGRSPDMSLRTMAQSLQGVNIIGDVSDLRPYIAQGAIYVSPILFGSGLKNRVLEAMAMGKAVVATPQSCYGFQVLSNETPLLVADETHFAESVVQLLTNEELCRHLGRRARQLVLRSHSWTTVVERIQDLLQETVNGRLLSARQY